MHSTRFDVAALPPGQRASAWDLALSGFAVRAQARGVALDGRIERYDLAEGLGLSVLEGTPQCIAPEDGRTEDVVWLTLVLEGRATLRGGWHDAVAVKPGDLVFGKRGAAGSLELDDDFRLLMVNLPGALFSCRSPLPLPSRAVHLDGSASLGRVLSSMLATAAACASSLDPEQARALRDALPGLLLASLPAQGAAESFGGIAGQRARLLQSVWASIEARLGDARLSIGTIAEQHRLKVRYLQRLFEDSGTTFATHLRERRLEATRASLADPRQRDVSITTLCLHWGFADSATFSRAFRRAYGTTPRAYRSHALPSRDGRRRLGDLAFDLRSTAAAHRPGSGLTS